MVSYRVEMPDSNSMIMFYYDAVGMLQRQESIEDSTIVTIKDYIGAIEYINGSPHIIQHENGYILLDRGLSEEHLLLIGVESGDSTYESVSTISKRTINNPDSIEYRAEEFIVLTNGFEVNLGADFAALIDTFPIMDLAYRYHIYDHLGNMRVEFKDNGMGSAVTTSQHHYYPFGAEMEGTWQQTNDVSQQSYMRLGGNRITYFDMDLDLHAFRDYDPTSGLWQSPEPLSDLFPEWSSYSAMGNNPINNIDPLGLDWFRNTKSGEEYWEDRNEANEGEEYIGANHIVEGKSGYVLHHQNQVIASYDKKDLSSSAAQSLVSIMEYETSNFIPRATGGLEHVYPEAMFFPGPKLGIGGGVSTTLGFAAFKYGDDLFKIGSNARKMQLDEISKVINKGPNWHNSGAKTKFIKEYLKKMKGDTNADFWIDKGTNEVLLKGNKSGTWVKTGKILK